MNKTTEGIYQPTERWRKITINTNLNIIHHEYVRMYVCMLCMYVRMYAMYVCMYAMYAMYVCMYVCYVCMYVCTYVRMYAMLLPDSFIFGRHTFRGSSMTPRSGRLSFIFLFYPAVTLYINNQITLCSYYAQLSAMLCEQ